DHMPTERMVLQRFDLWVSSYGILWPLRQKRLARTLPRRFARRGMLMKKTFQGTILTPLACRRQQHALPPRHHGARLAHKDAFLSRPTAQRHRPPRPPASWPPSARGEVSDRNPQYATIRLDRKSTRLNSSHV